jgi:hypothetical protein
MADVRRELLEKSKAKAKRRRRIWQGIFATLFVLFIIGIILFLRWEKIRVATIEIAGNKTVQTEDLKKYIENKITGQWFYLIPKNNSLFVSKHDLGQNILVDFPDISEIKIKRDGFTKLDLKVSERAPEILWCRKNASTVVSVPVVSPVVATATTGSSTSAVLQLRQDYVEAGSTGTTSDNDKCFYSDKTGFIFADAPNFSGNVMFKVYGLLSDEPIGGRPLPQEDFTDLLQTIDALPELFKTAGLSAVTPKNLSMDSYGDCKVTIAGTDLIPDWQVIFHYRQDLNEVANNLHTIFSSTEFKADKANSGALDYIDLRFGKKVFYKFK